MDASALGSVQYWGLAPALLIARPEERAAVLFLEHADLRYFFKNLPRLQGCDLWFHERQPLQIARLLVKLAVLHMISLEDAVQAKVELAHCYAELHGNVRVSDAAAALLKSAAAACRKCFAGGHGGSATTQFLQDLVGFEGVKSTQRDDIYNVLTDFMKAGPSGAPGTADQAKTKLAQATASIEESFDVRLRDLQAVPYDARHRVCLWPWHFDLAAKLPFTHELFYSSFRVSGISYLRAYFRMPQLLGGKERLAAVARRAPTSAESRMHCASENRFLGRQFTGEVLLGPWMENGFDWLFAGYSDAEAAQALRQLPLGCLYSNSQGDEPAAEEKRAALFSVDLAAFREELYGSFAPAGPDSFEPLLTSVELSVINLLTAAEMLRGFRGRIQCTLGDFQQVYARESFRAKFDVLLLSLEAERFLPSETLRHAAKDDAKVVAELAEFIPQYEQRAEFREKTLRLLQDGEALSCGGAFPGKIKENGKPYYLQNTHAVGSLKRE